MPRTSKFRIETYEGFYGDENEVLAQMLLCKHCGQQLVQSHIPDYNHMMIQESSSCPDCGEHKEKVVHKIN